MAPPAKKRKTESVLNLSVKYQYINPSKNFLSKRLLNYILKNSSQKAYYKLIQMSKYFLVKQPPQITTISSIYYAKDRDHSNPDPNKVSEITGDRLWIKTLEFIWRCSTVPMKSLLQRCFRIDTNYLELINQELTCYELRLLMGSGNITFLDISQCEITHSNGEEVAIEDILKMVPLIDHFYYEPCEPFTFSCQNVAGLPDFDYLETIELSGITEDFSCKAFRKFLKKAPSLTSGRFKFNDVSPRYLREFHITVLKEIDPTIEVNCSNGTIFFKNDEED